MNGLGNDFVVVQPGPDVFDPTPDQARAIADRIDGIGCDQLIVLDPSSQADIHMRIWNADGSEVNVCGNAARCVAWLLMRASTKRTARLETGAGILEAFDSPGSTVTVDMGAPGLEWTAIPLAAPMDTLELDLRVESARGGPSCVSMGNPHVVFFVDDVRSAPVESLGPWLERHQRFPEGANVGFAQIVAPDRMRLRVWERGVGLTRACGTGACAAVVAASRRGLASRRMVVEMEGGELVIEWREGDDHVLMNGPVEVEFTGRLPQFEDSASERSESRGSGDEPVAANDVGYSFETGRLGDTSSVSDATGWPDSSGFSEPDDLSAAPATDPFRRA
jgi:diaminopimelate epimerase